MMPWLALLPISAVVGAVIGVLAVKLFIKPHRYANQKPYQPPGEFVREEGRTTIEIWHLEGLPWYKAPIPPEKHLCWTQTKGTLSSGSFTRRCACGAVSMNDHDDQNIYWMERNSRKVVSS